MNKVIKDFQDDLVHKQLNTAELKEDLLIKKLAKISGQNNSMKNRGGLKEALRL